MSAHPDILSLERAEHTQPLVFLRIFTYLVHQYHSSYIRESLQYARKGEGNRAWKRSTHFEPMDPWVKVHLPRHSCWGPLQGGPIARGRGVAGLARRHHHGLFEPLGSLLKDVGRIH